MNIKEAKQEIIHTVQAYLAKDALGMYRIPVEKQRPILLMGPPGIGKTQIMEQIARECGINLVSYTITHHTRQSAIGLPFIEKHEFGGREYSVTEYTMSEIVASVYRQIECSGKQEGILFLDEINCVSETLSPVMLQFLQYKTFGTHRLPEGFVVVTAGNPPQYNKSVRDFDIVTLDRVKRIDVEENFGVWKEYAYEAGVHGSILSYLEIKKEHFFRITAEIGKRRFVTARGWEDLSRALTVYEDLGIQVDREFVQGYVQDEEIAADFALYLELYRKYRDVYRVPDILEGNAGACGAQVRGAGFDEKLGLLSLLVDALGTECAAFQRDLAVQKELHGALKAVVDVENPMELLEKIRWERGERLRREREAGFLSREDEAVQREALSILDALPAECAGIVAGQRRDASAAELPESGVFAREAGLQETGAIREWFAAREAQRQARITETDRHMTNVFTFLEGAFGEGQEMVMFITELSRNSHVLGFVQEVGNEAYYRYNRLLLLDERQRELEQEILALG